MLNSGGMVVGSAASRVGLASIGARAWVLTASSLCLACVSSGARGSPLYPHSGPPLPLAQVATLSGHVQEVDGQDVSSLVPPFELLPGCHVVRTPERWGSIGVGMSATAQTGMLPFALPMQAGHFYNIEVQTQIQTTIAGTLEIQAIETNATGQRTKVFPITKDAAELQACGKAE